MTDELAVTGIECYGHSRRLRLRAARGQVFVIDLVLGIDTAPAAASDDLRDTDDYGSLVASVKAAVEGSGRPDRDPRPADRGRLSLGTIVLNGRG